jgi:hypothetical protein
MVVYRTYNRVVDSQIFIISDHVLLVLYFSDSALVFDIMMFTKLEVDTVTGNYHRYRSLKMI